MNIKRTIIGLCLVLPLSAGLASAEPIGYGHLLAVFAEDGLFDRDAGATDRYTVAHLFNFGPGEFPDALTVSDFPAYMSGEPLPELPFGEFFLLGAVFSAGTGPSHLLMSSASGAVEPVLTPIGEPFHSELIAGSTDIVGTSPVVFSTSAFDFWSDFSFVDPDGFAEMFFEVPIAGDGAAGPVATLNADGGFEGGEDIFGFDPVFRVGFLQGSPGAPEFLSETEVLFRPIPEPTSLVLMGIGLVGVAAARRRRRAA